MREPIRKMIRVILMENRDHDAWFDFSLRQLREGNVRFYRVADFLTGDWLFKVCIDKELGKIIVKALKCPPGRIYTQIEGDTMVFQRSILKGFVYDIISLTYINEDGRVRRRVITDLDEVPPLIKENFGIKRYNEATGKRIPGKNFVTLVGERDVKGMIMLFLMERAWPLAPVTPEIGLKEDHIIRIIKDAEKAAIDEIYIMARDRLEMRRDEVNKLLALLRAEKKIDFPSPGYVKIIKE